MASCLYTTAYASTLSISQHFWPHLLASQLPTFRLSSSSNEYQLDNSFSLDYEQSNIVVDYYLDSEIVGITAYVLTENQYGQHSLKNNKCSGTMKWLIHQLSTASSLTY